jgi:glycosyltransferase involved in cell wall biosynthesis
MGTEKKKLIRVTTSDISLDLLLKGQLRFLDQYYDVVGVAANTGLLKDVAKREGIRVVELSMRREISLRRDVACLLYLINLFRKEHPYIVHANTPKGSLLAMMAAWVIRVPNRIYLVTGLRYQGAKGKARTLLMMMERLACALATKVIPEGEGVKATLIADGITKKPLQVVHHGNINGIDTSHFSPEACKYSREEMRHKLDIEPDVFTFIFIGRIVKDKGMNELARAMMRLKSEKRDCRLILVGWFEKEQDRMDEDNEYFFMYDDSVRYVGYQKDVRSYLLASDALVFPSYREGFPHVVMEAGAMGLPSIVTDINGCNEIIVDGENGHIIPPRDGEALLKMMRHFLDCPDEVKRMAGNARQMISSRYEHDDVMQALLQMYDAL